ncbi:hypothetical protein GOL89_28730 [Sinorhizobium medicae]|nr:hypothetical protein [Sinorhizobium medicae]
MARSSLFPASVQPGKPRLGICPTGWTTVTFGDVLGIVERPIDLNDEVEYQLVTAKRSRGGVVARSILKGAEILTKTQFRIERDDFLMSNRQIIHGGCGIVPPALHDAVVSNEYSVLRPKPPLLLEYLGYLTHSIYFQQTCFHASVGVDVEKMIFDCERWLKFKLHLPPLHEQRRIAEILSSVDDAISATRDVIDQTRKVKQGVLERLLTRGLGHEHFKHTEIGELPEDWETRSLAQICERGLFADGDWIESKDQDPDGKVRLIQLSDIGDGIFLDKTSRFINHETARRLNVTFLKKGDILLARMPDPLGRCCIFPLEVESITAVDVCIIRPVEQIIDGAWLSYCLNSPSMRSRIDAQATGTTRTRISRKNLGALILPLPPLSEQRSISEKLLAFDNALSSSRARVEELQITRKALMSDLLTGRRRVTDPLPIAAE